MNPEYVAGFFDGEGCVRISRGAHRSGRTYYTLQVIVVNTHLPNLVELRKCFGGTIMARKRTSVKHKQTFRWRICSIEAAVFLLTIQPFLRVKQREAEIAIAFQNEMRHLGNRYHLTPESVMTAREKQFQEITALKKTAFSLNEVN